MNLSHKAEVEQILEFLKILGQMFDRADFLLPIVAGQRQFREDNYQMASASQLEDLFHDALGSYIRENHPRRKLRRRTGKEIWDYALDDLQLSHKESQVPGFAVWWTSGAKDEDSDQWIPLSENWAYECPIVFVYTGSKGKFQWSSIQPQGESALFPAQRTGKFQGLLGLQAIQHRSIKAGSFSLALLSLKSNRRMRIEDVWQAGQWETLKFDDIWPSMGGPGLGRRDIWLDRFDRTGHSGLESIAGHPGGIELEVLGLNPLPGIYVFTTDELREIPLVANNRAHSASPEFVEGLMRRAASEDRYLPMPLWYAAFANSQPPNLYARQRTQFEQLFAPRARTID